MQVAIVLIMTRWVFTANAKESWRAIRSNYFVWFSLCIYGVILSSIIYAEVPFTNSLRDLGKYRDLLYTPILCILFSAGKLPIRMAIQSFQAGMVVNLIASALMYSGLLTSHHGDEGCSYFNNEITHSILMAFFAYLMVRNALFSSDHRKRIISAILAMAAYHNLFFLAAGKTGWVVALVLLTLSCYQRFKIAGVAIGLVSASILAIGMYSGHAGIQTRVDGGFANVRQYFKEGSRNASGHMGKRLDLFHSSVELGARHPWFGIGAGAFPLHYSDYSRVNNTYYRSHPHNQYLLFLVEYGIVGLSILIFYYLYCLYGCRHLPKPLCDLAEAVTVTHLVAGLFNSSLIESKEGFLFVFFLSACFSQLGTEKKSSSTSLMETEVSSLNDHPACESLPIGDQRVDSNGVDLSNGADLSDVSPIPQRDRWSA